MVESSSTAIYLINRSPSKNLRNQTPYEMWTGKKPDLSHLKTFGCKALAHIPKEIKQKWDEKSKPCIFLGYLQHTQGYRLWDKKKIKVFKSRDVIIYQEKNKNTEGKENEKQISKDENKKYIYKKKKSSSSYDLIILPATNDSTEDSDSVEVHLIENEERIDNIDDNEDNNEENDNTVCEINIDEKLNDEGLHKTNNDQIVNEVKNKNIEDRIEDRTKKNKKIQKLDETNKQENRKVG